MENMNWSFFFKGFASKLSFYLTVWKILPTVELLETIASFSINNEQELRLSKRSLSWKIPFFSCVDFDVELDIYFLNCSVLVKEVDIKEIQENDYYFTVLPSKD